MMHWKADKASKLGAHLVPLQKVREEKDGKKWCVVLPPFFLFFLPQNETNSTSCLGFD
jgi:hypothetical protein